MEIPGLGHLCVPCCPGIQGNEGCDSLPGDPLRALTSTVASTDPAGQEYARNSASLEVSTAVLPLGQIHWAMRCPFKKVCSLSVWAVLSLHGAEIFNGTVII